METFAALTYFLKTFSMMSLFECMTYVLIFILVSVPIISIVAILLLVYYFNRRKKQQ